MRRAFSLALLEPCITTRAFHPTRVRSLSSAPWYLKERVRGLPKWNFLSKEPRMALPKHVETLFPESSQELQEENAVDHLLDSLRGHGLEPMWAAYRGVLDTHPLGAQAIPTSALRDIAFTISSTRPRTRENFLRLVSVVNQLQNRDNIAYLTLHNALIDYCGKSYRKTREEDYTAAVAAAQGMTSIQGITLDRVTLNTILSIAVLASSESAIAHALELFRAHPHIKPDRITHLSLLKYYAHTDQIDRVFDVVGQIVHGGYPVRMDVFNPVLWAYGLSGKLDLMMQLYSSLRGVPGCAQYKHRHPILTKIPKSLVPLPDNITYTTVIQCQTYHGDLSGAFTVLRHMLKRSESEKQYRRWHAKPTTEIYRALFLGFAKHSKPPQISPSDDSALPTDQHTSSHVQAQAQAQEWSYEHLQMLYRNFLVLPRSATPPNQRMLYWLLVSLWRTSGEDMGVVTDAVEQLAQRWGRSFVLRSGGRVTKFLQECRDGGATASSYRERQRLRSVVIWGRSDWSLGDEGNN